MPDENDALCTPLAQHRDGLADLFVSHSQVSDIVAIARVSQCASAAAHVEPHKGNTCLTPCGRVLHVEERIHESGNPQRGSPRVSNEGLSVSFVNQYRNIGTPDGHTAVVVTQKN